MPANSKILIPLLAALCLLNGYTVLRRGLQPVYAVTKILEWDVFASCEPHAQVQSPDSLTVRFVNLSRPSGPQVTAFLSGPGLAIQQSPTHRWNFPEKGWHTVVFAGPPITGRFYCQDAPTTKRLHLSYHRGRDVKIGAGLRPDAPPAELDAINSLARNNLIPVTIRKNKTGEYAAGRDTENPYWLTFSVPVHSSHRIQTRIQYQFE